jgi:thioredoxin 1
MEIIQNFEELNAAIAASEHNIVLIDCYTEWCGPCKRLTPLLTDLLESLHSSGNTNVKFYKLNIENPEVRDWVSMKEIESVPTIFIMKENKDVEKIEGADFKRIQEVLQELTK